MSDPLLSDDHRPLTPASSEADRAAKIEQLLLAGLEHYFALQYDQAINVWTRALFLDRGHARARAYIERARSAQAECLRESEELLQRGVTAFNQGEAEKARRLLRDAMAQGAPPEQALAILERLNRLQQVVPPAARPRQGVRGLTARLHDAPRASRAAWIVLSLLVSIIVAAGAFAAGAFRVDLQPLLDRPNPSGVAAVRPSIDEGLPLPRRGEIALTRARALVQSGRLREALAALDVVKPTDPQKIEADRLRADIQKQLIGLSTSTATPEPQGRP
jgi:tetratricopeptide (TPR) repeat protein